MRIADRQITDSRNRGRVEEKVGKSHKIAVFDQIWFSLILGRFVSFWFECTRGGQTSSVVGVKDFLDVF